MTGSVPAGDLLTAAEAGVLLSRELGGWYSADKVHRLARAGELERVKFGWHVRITPESVAAYRQRQAAGSDPAGDGA